MGARPALIAAVLLIVFAAIGVGLVAYTHQNTESRILENRRQALLQRLHRILPTDSYDNTIEEDTIEVVAPDHLGTAQPQTVYRARRQGRPVAAVLTAVAPNGYNGPIHLLIGIYRDGRVAGVRVVAHAETPGLGDAIEAQRSDWILGFDGKSLGDPPEDKWRVKRDGGVFDQITGATVTPRAVVQAVRRALVYFDANREALFGAPAGAMLSSGGSERPRRTDDSGAEPHAR